MSVHTKNEDDAQASGDRMHQMRTEMDRGLRALILCLALVGLSCGSSDGGNGSSDAGTADAGSSCTPGETFDADDGCNTCTCPESGKTSEAACTEMACAYEPCAGKTCGDTCTVCDPNDADCMETAVEKACNEAGECSADTGEECIAPDACTPGETFDAADGCNTCTCPESGKKSEAGCTEMACIYEPCAGKACGDACTECDPNNTDCTETAEEKACDNDGVCTADTGEECIDPDACTPGETFDAADGCNTCTCPESGKKSEAGCTEMACIYEPCAGKACGDACTECDPNDTDCVETAVEKACNEAGECTADTGKLCAKPEMCTPGESFDADDGCNTCTCPESGIKADAGCTKKLCNYDPCKDKACGDPCTVCDPNDTDCIETAVIKACDPGGTCVADTGDLCAVEAEGCHGDADCTAEMGDMCFYPGQPLGCGICMEPFETCSADTDCAATMICEQSGPEDCLCSPETICKPGCTGAADCGAGETCEAMHCVAIKCTDDAGCPVDFTCEGDQAVLIMGGGECQRATCKDDKDCSGYCVQGKCYDSLGTCGWLPV